MSTVISELFGEYVPIVTVLTDGTEKVTIDYGYFAGVFLFALCLYCMFRILGSLFGGKK